MSVPLSLLYSGEMCPPAAVFLNNNIPDWYEGFGEGAMSHRMFPSHEYCSQEKAESFYTLSQIYSCIDYDHYERLRAVTFGTAMLRLRMPREIIMKILVYAFFPRWRYLTRYFPYIPPIHPSMAN